VAKVLSGAIEKIESEGLLKRIKVGKKEIRISMFKFVDDIMFVCKVKTQILWSLKVF